MQKLRIDINVISIDIVKILDDKPRPSLDQEFCG
jgi:hypothetical protein